MMDPEDVGKILAIAAPHDRRTVGESDIQLWARALDGLDPSECAAAVQAHYTDPETCDRYLVAGHVIGRVSRKRREAADRRKNADQMRAIEASRAEASRGTEARDACRRAFDEAIAAAKAQRGTSDEAATA